MVSIEDRLRELGYTFNQEGIPQRPRKIQAGRSLTKSIPGEWYYNKYGGVYVVNKTFILEENLDLSHFSNDMAVIQQYIGYEKGNIGFDDLIFLDIETTGLASDAGTYAFLVGIGKFTSGSFELSQFFLNNPVGEMALLEQLEKHLTSSSIIVSYNGKSFDVPHIRSRYQYHDWPNPLQDHYHIDLLHLARKIWKARLPNRSLGMIEDQILNIQRAEEDVPGWMVAQLYLEYLHTQDAAPLARIFYHNEVDVVSLSKLLQYMAAILTNPIDSDIQHGLDLISIGKFYADMGDLGYAVQVYLHGLEFDDVRGDEYQLAISELALIHKKQEQYADAVRLWEIAYNNGNLNACIELAKYYEHRARELEKAIGWTHKALDLLDSEQYMQYEKTMLTPEIEHRLNRLMRKIKTDNG